MAKIIPTKYVEGIVKPGSRYNTFSGFVSVDSHSASLKTLDEVFEGNRLDYQNTPYSPGVDETYAKINFTLDSKMRLDIPLEEPKWVNILSQDEVLQVHKILSCQNIS